MSPIAIDLADALLEHRRAVRERGGVTGGAADMAGLPYGDLWQRIGSPGDLVQVGGYLKEVAAWCAEQGWPPLNALAVNGKKRRPGRRYEEAPGCSLERWAETVRTCLDFSGYPERAG